MIFARKHIRKPEMLKSAIFCANPIARALHTKQPPLFKVLEGFLVTDVINHMQERHRQKKIAALLAQGEL